METVDDIFQTFLQGVELQLLIFNMKKSYFKNCFVFFIQFALFTTEVDINSML